MVCKAMDESIFKRYQRKFEYQLEAFGVFFRNI
jgi:hypothetical protein